MLRVTKNRLKRELSGRTLIITGMRKSVKIYDVIASFKVFGLIENIALAPISRSFGKLIDIFIY